MTYVAPEIRSLPSAINAIQGGKPNGAPKDPAFDEDPIGAYEDWED